MQAIFWFLRKALVFEPGLLVLFIKFTPFLVFNSDLKEGYNVKLDGVAPLMTDPPPMSSTT